MEEATPSFRRPECLSWASLYSWPKAAAGKEPQFRVLCCVLFYARLLEGAGFHVREPVASSPQPGQLKSRQLHFKDGKLKLSQGQGLAPDTS